ncbi:G protein-coupled receptor family protein [Rhodococcus xishaensis]|uniref:Permease n=1 Tax=Rhodococcus xishaensis TaxID=2487364 RepID=A0A3S3CLZ4_9NOCA|nr:hypothetical protein [Rhodococcus xishaensis]RVW00739.1 hypothetical protein EGT50_15500 [Rhodococcus xishaensis]
MSASSAPVPGSSPTAESARRPAWVKKTVWALAILAALVVAYFVLAAFLPRWWSHQVAALSSGSFSTSVLLGLLFGVVCTALALLLFYFAWRARRRKHARFWVTGGLILGVVVALPNLLTLTVVLGGSSAAHAGERTLDVDAPGFRGASLWGAIIGVFVFGAAVFLLRRYRQRGEEVAKLRGDLHQREPQSPGESPGPEI